MKRIVTLVMVMSVFVQFIYAQKIVVNEVDKFNGETIMETSTETLWKHSDGRGWDAIFKFSIRKVDSIFVMPAYILLPDVVKYDENSYVQFLFSNGKSVSLKSMYTGVSGERYANGYWFSTILTLTDDDINLLRLNDITDVRISYFSGHYDKSIAQSKQDIIKKAFALFE